MHYWVKIILQNNDPINFLNMGIYHWTGRLHTEKWREISLRDGWSVVTTYFAFPNLLQCISFIIRKTVTKRCS